MARAQRAGRVIVASSRDQATSLAALRAREANTPASVIAVAPITVKNATPEASRYVDRVAFGWTLLRSYSATRYAVYAWDVSALLIGIEQASSVIVGLSTACATGATTARPVTERIAVSILASTIETLVFPVMTLLRFVFRCFSHGARHYADNVRDSTSGIPRRTSSASRSHSCTSGIWSAAMAVRTISPHVRLVPRVPCFPWYHGRHALTSVCHVLSSPQTTRRIGRMASSSLRVQQSRLTQQHANRDRQYPVCYRSYFAGLLHDDTTRLPILSHDLYDGRHE